jgi:hypothetical protein
MRSRWITLKWKNCVRRTRLVRCLVVGVGYRAEKSYKNAAQLSTVRSKKNIRVGFDQKFQLAIP